MTIPHAAPGDLVLVHYPGEAVVPPGWTRVRERPWVWLKRIVLRRPKVTTCYKVVTWP